MSIKEEMQTVDSPGEAMSFSHRLKSLSVRWKIRIAYWAGILLTSCLVILMVSTYQRRTAVHHAYDKVYLLRSVKTKLAEAWFSRLTNQITDFASDQKTLDMQGQLAESFLNIEKDNYSTPGAETPEKVNSLLEGFYVTEVIPVLENRMDKKIPLSSVLPSDNKQQILQYLYIAANTKPFGSKLAANKAADGSSYTSLHSQIQPVIVKYASETGISDIFFVDYKSGYVVYSLQKNPDFATNLYDGPYHNSGLGQAFKAAIGLPAGSFRITDESLYAGDLLEPALFISAPLFAGNEIKGAVVFEVDASSLDGILAMEKEDEANIPGLKSFFVGPDLLYRNNDPSLARESERYIRRMKRLADDGRAYSQVEKLKTTAMVQQVNSLAFAEGLGGKERMKEYRTETGEQVLSSYGPVGIPGLKWLLVSQLDKSQALKPVRQLTGYLIIVSLVLALLAYIIVHILSDKLAARLTILGGFLHNGIQAGKNSGLLKTGGDEIETAVSAAQMLKERIHEASKYTDQLGEGNLEGEISFGGEDDKLGLSLNNLKNILIDRREKEQTRIREDEIRNWSTHGVALFNDILRLDNNNLEKLCLNIIRNTIQYLSANQGGIFLIDKEEGATYLDLVAAYAFDRQKFLKKRIGIGEGLAGTCAMEKKTILLSRIPQDYMEITSGLGGAKPSCLLIVPLKKEEEVLGVMEMASFSPFKPHEVEFVEKVAESIASALITVRLHLQTSQYLERFQQQAEEMKAQDEELRQNIEELQATHEQMERMKAEEDTRNQQMIREIEQSSFELQKEKALLDALLNNVPEHIYFKDKESRFLRFSKSMLKLFGLEKAEDLVGKSDFDFFDEEHSRPAYEGEQEIMRTGKAIIDLEEKEVMEDGRVSWVNTTKMPLRDSNGNIIGTFGISKNITHLKRLEQDAVEKNEEMKAQEEELRQNLEEMHTTQDDMRRQIEENEKMQDALSKEKSLLDALLNNVPEHIYFKDKESKFLRFSKSMIKLFGLEKAEDLVGKSDFDFFDEEHSRPAFEGEQEIIRTGKAIIDLEEKEVMEDGRVSWVNTTKMPLRNARGEIIGTFGISKDISKLKKLESDANLKADKLVENEEYLLKYRKLLIDILDRIPGKVFLKDENGVFVVVNSAVASIYNKSPEQIIGTTDYDNHPDENVDEWRKQELEIIKKGASTYVHLEKIKGKQHYLNTTKMPFELATSGKTGLLGIQFDISDVKVLEEKIASLTKEIEALKKGRGTRDQGPGTRD
jgi:PAS domain S-box-containing protein